MNYTSSEPLTTEVASFQARRVIEKKLAKAQRKLSRMAERAIGACKNYQEQWLKVARLHKQATARNEDFQHILSKRLVES